MNITQYIKTLVQQGQLKPAIDTLIKVAPLTYYENNIVTLSSFYHDAFKAFNSLDTKEQMRAKTDISQQILYLVNQIAETSPPNGKVMTQVYEAPVPPSPAEPEPTQPQQQLRKILFMSANPAETTALKLTEEMRDIKDTLKSSRDRDDFDFILEPQVNASIIRQRIKEERPEIVHFSGHGGLDTGLAEGIVVNGNDNKPQVIPSRALGRLFEMAKDYVKCVVLNSCYSDTQAEAIKAHIPHVIGMNDAIDNASARMFSVGFYEALGLGESYEDAFNSGTLAIEMEGLPGADVPILL